MFQALRIPDFRLLLGAGLVSSLGSWLLVLAVPAHILAVTGSLRDTGLTLAAAYLPQLALGPVAGAVADRWDRRRLMIGANLLCAGAVVVMLAGTSPGRYWVLYAALAAENAGVVLYAPALQARTPAIVGTGPLLSSANSLTSASSGVVRLIGGPLGGVLLAVCGIRWLICADAASYLLAAAAVFMTSRSGGGHPSRTALVSAVAGDLAKGAHMLRAQPVAWALLPVTAVFLTANASLSAVLIPFGVQRLGGSEHAGLLLSCLGVGFLLGAPVIRASLDRAGPRNLLAASLAATAGAYFLLFTSSSLATALPAAAAVGMSGSMALVTQQTTLQRVIPDAVLGRVSAVFLASEAAATLAGSVAGPFLAQAAHLAAVAAGASLLTLSAIVSGPAARIIDLLRQRECCWNPVVCITSETVADGIREQLFTVGDIPGVLWTPAEGSGPRPLVLIGHGGGQHKKEPGVVSRAFPYVTSCGFAVAAIDAPGTGDRPEHPEIRRLVAVIQEREAAGEPRGPAWPALSETVASQLIPDWQATLDALQELDSVGDSQPVGYYGLSQGGEMGIRLVAAEPRITAAVLGLIGSDWLIDTAARITIPVEFVLQWDDEGNPRDSVMKLFDALGSAEKTLHANPGSHYRVPSFEIDSSVRFFARHLGSPGTAGSS